MTPIIVSQHGNSKTVTAARNIKSGEKILTLKGNIQSFPTKYSIQIGFNTHLIPISSNPLDTNSIWQYLNHSCSPNAYFNIENLTLLAKKNILKGQEINFNYNTTEYEMASPFTCYCQSANCLGTIKGYNYLSYTEKNKIADSTPQHIIQITLK